MKSPWDFFEVIYCINLIERKDRWALVQEEFEKIGIKDKVIQIPGQRYNGFSDNHRNACIGNHLSHAYCMQRSLDLGYNNCLIFEDDVNFFHDGKTTNSILTDFIGQISRPGVATWDMLYLGANLDVYKAIRQDRNFARLAGAYATHAYAVNKSMFEKLIALNKNVETVHNDVSYANEIIPNCNTYITIPMLAGQRESYSDIEGKVMTYNAMLLDRFEKGLVDG